MNRFGFLALLVLLVSCSNPISNQPSPSFRGLLKVDVALSGDASAQWVKGVQGQAVSVKPINGTSSLDDVQFTKTAVGTYDDLINNRRYVVTTFNLTNRSTIDFNNLTLYATHVPGVTRAGTGIASIRDVAGNLVTDEAVYRGFQPSHGMGPGVGGLQVSPNIADLQWITSTEASDAKNQAINQKIIPDDATVLQYGFVARNIGISATSLRPMVVAGGGRTIAARNLDSDCTIDACKGSITLSYSFPIQTPTNTNPFRFTLYFVAADESNSLVSQSLEEQSANTVAGLTDTTSFLQTRILPGSTLSLGQDNLSNLCQIKTAVPSALNPSNVLLPSSIPTTPGSLDLCFGVSGKRTTDFGSNQDLASSLAIQPDGKIVTAGLTFSSNRQFALVRYNPDGSLDTGFDGDGKVSTSFGANNSQANGVAIQPDGKIVAAGTSTNTSGIGTFAVARYNPDGSLDTSFDGDGKVNTSIGSSSDNASSLVLQSDGKIVVAGYSSNGSNRDFALVRYNPDGTLDTTFDGDGKVTTPVGSGDDVANAVAIQTDGKIVAVGYSSNGTDADFGLVRYNPDGSLDTGFDSDGIVTTAVNIDFDIATGVVIQSDGKIVAGGRVGSTTATDFALVRYNPDGLLDTTFDGDGKAITSIGSGNDNGAGLVLQSDGKIVVGGVHQNTSNNWDFALIRYNPDGSLDTTFDGDGIVTTALGSGDDVANAIALQSDGKIVLAGYSRNGVNNNFAVARFNP